MFTSFRRYLQDVAVVVGAALLLACAGERGSTLPPTPGSTDEACAEEAQNYPHGNPVSLDSALAELGAMEIPDGVDSALFGELRDTLREALVDRGAGKLISSPPIGSDNQVTDIASRDNGDGTYDLTWYYRNLGDYDQNGTVGISDITPLAMHYKEPVELWDSIQDVVDGGGNLVVDISDITPIAMYYGVEMAEYLVEHAPAADGAWTPIDSVAIGEGQGDGRLRLTATVTPESGNLFFHVVPCDCEENRGIESQVLELSSNAPDILAVEPQAGEVDEVVEFTATVAGKTPFEYSWDFGGGATPDTSDEAAPSVELGPAGDFDASLTVTNLFGEDVYEFTLSVESTVEYDETENNDSAGEANDLPAFDFAGFICNLGVGGYDGDSSDYFEFTVGDPGTVDLTMTLDSAMGDLELQLLDTDGTTVLDYSNTAGDVEFISYELADGGTYYLHCLAHSGNSDYTIDGTFEIAVEYDEEENNDNIGEANELPEFDFADFIGSLGAGGYDGDNNDYFQFTVDEEGAVELTMTLDSATGDLEIQLLDTDGTTVLDYSNTAGDTEFISYELPVAGTYYLHCLAHSGYTDYMIDGTFEGHGPAVPHVLFVSPQVVEQNVATELTATTTGFPTSYSWSFGPGAVPPVSTDEQPLVTFGITGECSCSLTVTNVLGDDTCDFVVLVPEVTDTNMIILMPSRTEAVVGDIIGVAVYAWDIAFPLGYLDSCEFAYTSGITPVEDSDNLGAPGGEQNAKDGFWTIMPDNVMWLLVDSPSVVVGVTPLGFPPIGVPAGTSGALFNLQFTAESAGTASLQFVHAETHYAEPDFTQHFFDVEVNGEVDIS